MSDVPRGTQDQSPEDRDALVRRLTPSFAPGDAVPGLSSWVLEQRLGGGGFGEVWLARHKWDTEQRPRAVKFCTDPDTKHRLVTHEQNVIVRVMKYAGKHLNIVPLLDCNLDGAVPWLMYEFVDGGTLAHVIEQWRELSLSERIGRAVRMLHTMAGALATMHRLNPPIVHRDLKPQNVLMANGVPRITDFGIGSVALPDKQGATTGAQTAFAARIPSALQGAGTRLYAPPEQMLGAPPNPRDDVYALGIIAYQLVLGDMQTAPGTDATLELGDLKVPAELTELIVRSVAMNAERRPKDAGEWEAALGALIDRAKTRWEPDARAVPVPPPLPEPQFVPATTEWLDPETRGALDRINEPPLPLAESLEPTERPNRNTTAQQTVPRPLPRKAKDTTRSAWLTFPRFVMGLAAIILVIFGSWTIDHSESPPRSDPKLVELFSKSWLLTENVGVTGGGWSRAFNPEGAKLWTFYRDKVLATQMVQDGPSAKSLFDTDSYDVEFLEHPNTDQVRLLNRYSNPNVRDEQYDFTIRTLTATKLVLVLNEGTPGLRTLTFLARPRLSRNHEAPLWVFVVVQLCAALAAHRVAQIAVTRGISMFLYWLVHGLVSLASLPLGLAYSTQGFLWSPQQKFVITTFWLSLLCGFVGGLIHLRRPRPLTPSSPASSP